MSSYVGPNGRIYKRERMRGKWIAAAVVCLSVIGLVIVGVPNVATVFKFVGL